MYSFAVDFGIRILSHVTYTITPFFQGYERSSVLLDTVDVREDTRKVTVIVLAAPPKAIGFSGTPSS